MFKNVTINESIALIKYYVSNDESYAINAVATIAGQ